MLPTNFRLRPNTESLLRTNIRPLRLKLIDGKAPKSSTGVTDTGLLTGENKMNAIFDEQTGLWRLKQVNGFLPPLLKQSFTSFNGLMKYAKTYYKNRNIDLEEDA